MFDGVPSGLRTDPHLLLLDEQADVLQRLRRRVLVVEVRPLDLAGLAVGRRDAALGVVEVLEPRIDALGHGGVGGHRARQRVRAAELDRRVGQARLAGRALDGRRRLVDRRPRRCLGARRGRCPAVGVAGGLRAGGRRLGRRRRARAAVVASVARRRGGLGGDGVRRRRRRRRCPDRPTRPSPRPSTAIMAAPLRVALHGWFPLWWMLWCVVGGWVDGGRSEPGRRRHGVVDLGRERRRGLDGGDVVARRRRACRAIQAPKRRSSPITPPGARIMTRMMMTP